MLILFLIYLAQVPKWFLVIDCFFPESISCIDLVSSFWLIHSMHWKTVFWILKIKSWWGSFCFQDSTSQRFTALNRHIHNTRSLMGTVACLFLCLCIYGWEFTFNLTLNDNFSVVDLKMTTESHLFMSAKKAYSKT